LLQQMMDSLPGLRSSKDIDGRLIR
jgi:hypothetical protein